MKKFKLLIIHLIRVLLEITLLYFVFLETGIATAIFALLMLLFCELSAYMFGRIGMRFVTHETNLAGRIPQIGKPIPTLEDLPNIEFGEEQFTMAEVAMAQRMDAGDLTVVPALMTSRAITKEYDFGAISLNDIEPFMRKMVQAVNDGANKRDEGNVLNYPKEDFPKDIEFDKEDDEDPEYPSLIDDDKVH